MVFAPGIGEYLCAHNVILAHARVYRLYQKDYFAKYNGKIGIVLNSGHTWPSDLNKPEDIVAADRSLQFWVIQYFKFYVCFYFNDIYYSSDGTQTQSLVKQEGILRS